MRSAASRLRGRSIGRANVEVYLGGLVGQTGDFERAFELIGFGARDL